jgi:hypothetical protein
MVNDAAPSWDNRWRRGVVLSDFREDGSLVMECAGIRNDGSPCPGDFKKSNQVVDRDYKKVIYRLCHVCGFYNRLEPMPDEGYEVTDYYPAPAGGPVLSSHSPYTM